MYSKQTDNVLQFIEYQKENHISRDQYQSADAKMTQYLNPVAVIIQKANQ
jgi:hypothetical protein